MNEKLIRLAVRRNQLIARAAEQRATLVRNIEPWRTPLARVDKGLSMLRYVRSHPVVGIAGGGALLVVLRFVRIGKWLQVGWVAWQMRHKLRK